MKKRNNFPWMQYDPIKVGEHYDGLSDAGIGAYTRLIRQLWMRGPLPENSIRLITGECADAIVPRLEQFGDGLSMPWLEEVREAADRTSEAQEVRARKGWEKRKTGMPGHAAGIPDQSSGHAAGMQNREVRIENREEREKETPPTPSPPARARKEADKVEYTAEFEEVFGLYERHGAKSIAFAYWQKLPEQDRVAVRAAIPAYIQSTSGDRLQFRKHFNGWINPANRLWEVPSFPVTSATPTLMTEEEAEAEMVGLRQARGLHPKWGAVLEAECSPRLRAYLQAKRNGNGRH